MKSIRLFIFSVLFGILFAGVACAQQYQPLNNSFEQWDGSAVDAEPAHWNSFATSTGPYHNLASSPHHYHRRNSDGTSYLTIYTRSILGIKANGNMTTGRIYAGSTTASSSSNYNYTERSSSDFSQRFTATPDSMYVWVSYYAQSASSKAQITAYVHGDCDFQDPNDAASASKYACKAVAQTTRTTSNPRSMQWQQLKVPFVYSGTSSPEYLLISMTTNMVPGGGSGDDSLSIDDIQFVYSNWLSDIRINGVSVSGFEKGQTSYHLGSMQADDPFVLECIPEVSDAEVRIDSSAVASDSSVLMTYTISVIAEDGSNRTYTVDRLLPADTPMGISILAGACFNVFPTITSGRISVENADDKIILLDFRGRVVDTYPQGTDMIDLGGIPHGIYVIRCGSTTKKIVLI